MTYHGAEGDPRYPSPRKLRNALAGLVDLILAFGALAAATVPVALTSTRTDPWIFLPGFAAIIGTVLVNTVLLPSWTGGSLGRITFGLVTIRGADGGRPRLRELARSAFRRNGVFFYGIQSDAPHLVIVRRHDTTAPETTSPGTYTEL